MMSDISELEELIKKVYIIMADYEVPRKYYLNYKDAEKALKKVNEDRMMGGAMTKAYIVELELGEC